MGHIQDRWTRPGPTGRRVKTGRWGQGMRWQARWTDPDGYVRTKACPSKDAATALIAKVTVSISLGSYVSITAGQESFRSYAETWRHQQLHHRATTAVQAESRLRLHVYPEIGHLPVAAIRRSDVQALVATISQRLSPATVRVTYAYVASVLRSAVDDKMIASSPCVRIKLPEVVRGRVEPLTWEQVQQLRDGMPPRWQAMLDVAAATGLRSGELRGLTVDRISPALHVRGAAVTSAVLRVDRQVTGRLRGGMPVFGPPKTPAADRKVRIGASTIEALVAHLGEYGVGPGGLVFHSREKGPLSRPQAGAVWRDAGAGMALRPRSGWHDLRHFHASVLIAGGSSVRAVADRLGHADPAETLRTYAHMFPADEARIVEAVERVMGGPRLH